MDFHHLKSYIICCFFTHFQLQLNKCLYCTYGAGMVKYILYRIHSFIIVFKNMYYGVTWKTQRKPTKKKKKNIPVSMRRQLIKIDGVTLHKNEEKGGEEDILSEPIHWLHAMPTVSLWVEERGRLHADHRPRMETDMGGWCMQCVCKPLSSSLSSKPGNGMGASSPGQVRVGAHKGGVWVHVERVCKCTWLEKKKRNQKKGLTNSNPHKNLDLHRPHMCYACACACVCCCCCFDSGVWMSVVGGVYVRRWQTIGAKVAQGWRGDAGSVQENMVRWCGAGRRQGIKRIERENVDCEEEVDTQAKDRHSLGCSKKKMTWP